MLLEGRLTDSVVAWRVPAGAAAVLCLLWGGGIWFIKFSHQSGVLLLGGWFGWVLGCVLGTILQPVEISGVALGLLCHK